MDTQSMPNENLSGDKPKFSIKLRLNIMIDIGMACILISCLIITSILTRKTSLKLIENSMTDMVDSIGDSIDLRLNGNEDKESVLSTDTLTPMLEGKKITGLGSSYFYIVSSDGTMLYHPTADKIGQPVENATIKGVVAEIQAGNSPKGAFTTYDFNGTIKMSSYYVSKSNDFVLVCSADQSDVTGVVSKMILLITIIAFIIGFIIAVIFAMILNTVIKPIFEATHVINRMSKLDFRIHDREKALSSRNDEFGVQGRAIIRLEQTLSNTINNIRSQSSTLLNSSTNIYKNASNMSDTSAQVDTAVEEIANGATSQAQETSNASDSVMQIGSMIQETTSEVNELKNTAAKMRSAHDDAVKTLEELGEVNNETKATIQTISEQTRATNESTQKIREVTGLISDIAEETNLLSLNASIEAARAGEAGRGFAVVASQIQKLADQSDNSAKQIEKIIDVLIQESEKSVATMEEVKDIIERQSSDVDRTSEAFQAVSDGIESSENGINSIAEKMNSMEEARANVVSTVESLSAIAEENAASTEESSASVSTISNIAGDMKNNSDELKNIANALEQNMQQFTC